MNIAICDDEINIRKSLINFLSNYFKEKLLQVDFHEFDDGNQLLNENNFFDIVFIDIEMPNLNGIDTSRQLKKQHPNTIIFIVTAFSSYLDDAFDVGAYRFIEKPIDIVRLYRSLDSALLSMSNKNISFTCKDNQSIIIPKNSIIYCENYNRKTKIITTNGEFLSKDKINVWKARLSELNFYSPHNSYIVNFNYIKSFCNKSLILSHINQEIEISISAKRQQEFRKKFFLYEEGGM